MPVHSVDSVVQSNFRYNVKRWNTKLGEEGPGDVPMIRHAIRELRTHPSWLRPTSKTTKELTRTTRIVLISRHLKCWPPET